MPTSTTTDRTRVTIYGAIVGIVALAIVGSALSPDSTIQILGFCSVVVAGLLTHLSSLNTAAKVEEEVVIAAAKVEEVRTDLKDTAAKADEKIDATFEVVKDIHTLTNSQMGLTLASNAALARWKADQTKGQKDYAENNDAADRAEAALNDHRAKQAVVDFRNEAK